MNNSLAIFSFSFLMAKIFLYHLWGYVKKLRTPDKSDWIAITVVELLLKNKINEHIIDINKAIKSLLNNLKNILSNQRTLS